MARLLEIRFENFCCFAKAKLALNNRGLVRVLGRNKDTEAASDNGSGKSTIFRGLHWCLFEETVERMRGKDDIIRAGQKSCSVETDIEGGYTIRRWRTKAARGVALLKDGVSLKFPEEEIERTIKNLLGYDAALARNTVYYAQGERRRFIYPDVTDAQRKAIIHSARRSERFELAHEVAKKRFVKAQKLVNKIELEIATQEARLGEYDLKALKERVRLWEDGQTERLEVAKEENARLKARHEEMSSSSPDVGAAKKRLERLEKSLKRYAEIERKLKAAKSELASSAHEISKARAQKVKYETITRGFDDTLEELIRFESCPLCSSPLDEGHAKKHIQELQDKRLKTVASLDVVKRWLTSHAESHGEIILRIAELEEVLNGRETVMEAIRGCKSDIDVAKKHDEMVKEASKAITAGIKRRLAIRMELNPHAAALEDALDKLNKISEDLLILKTRLKKAQSKLAHDRFWVAGCSPSGLPSFVLDEAMAPLTNYTNKYLSILTDSDISINFSTQRELRSGGKRDQIGIDWMIEGVADKTPSGGQWKKMEIGSQFGLMDLSADSLDNPPGLLILDEFLDSIDDVGAERMLDLVHSLRSKRHTIFVISHVASDVFETTVKVIKENGISRIIDKGAGS